MFQHPRFGSIRSPAHPKHKSVSLPVISALLPNAFGSARLCRISHPFQVAPLAVTPPTPYPVSGAVAHE